ncbi:MAG: ketopantoate reductase family protein [Candidatus Omnitrophica bacterium]|nr:ketopantoate reductase family protein [Candidatus Omnitrophota bacterium]MCF7878545.1 ketopantoate reductase family protein [Candidatus Omnitrophota bacterium]
MKIAVLGCGAIGGLFLGYLSKGPEDVLGVVRDYQKEPLEKEGLIIKTDTGRFEVKVKAGTTLAEPVDLAIFAVKTNDLETIVKENRPYLKNAIAVSTQNGVRADSILSNFFPEEKIVTAIVMFGATFCPPNKVIYNFPGKLVLGNIFGKKAPYLGEAKKILENSFNLEVKEAIKGAKYLKLFVNLNNCIPAVLGKPMQEVFKNLEAAELAIRLNREAYRVVKQAGISLESLPNYPKERIEKLVSMPAGESAQIFSKIMVNLSKEPLEGSILQSIKRGKFSEIDYINGEIVKLAKDNNQKAPLNKKIVELVHRVEKKGFLSEEELLSKIKGAENEK